MKRRKSAKTEEIEDGIGTETEAESANADTDSQLEMLTMAMADSSRIDCIFN